MNAPITTARAAKERGIPFNGPMVRAILEDKKRQTRRIVAFKGDAATVPPDEIEFVRMQDYTDGSFRAVFELCGELFSVRSPCGRPTDRLYVREAWRVPAEHDRLPPRGVPRNTSLLWLASAPHTEAQHGGLGWGRYRHARFMPRWASRITLGVTDVRVERLQAITEADARAEGVVPFTGIGADQRIACDVAERTQGTHPHVVALASLWDSINGERASWAANPWVWCVSFRRMETDHA